MVKYLQLRVHKLQCVRETQNRQNFMGIPLEIDPDSIDLQALVVDGGEGVVAQGPTVFLGNKYRSGKEERFSPPKVLAEIPVRDDDVFPRRVKVSLNMAEKDNGGGFDELMGEVAASLAGELSGLVGRELGNDVSSSDVYRQVETVAGDILEKLLQELCKALGLGDDPFKPVDISVQLDAASSTAPAGERQVRFREPNPAHKGEFVLTYSWTLSGAPQLDTAPPVDATDPGGRVVAALTTSNGYGRSHRVHRFRGAARKQTTAKTLQPKQIRVGSRSFSWYPTPIRLMASQPK